MLVILLRPMEIVLKDSTACLIKSFRAASCKKSLRKNKSIRKNKSTRKHILYLKMCFLVELFFLIDFYMKRPLVKMSTYINISKSKAFAEISCSYLNAYNNKIN